MLSAWLEPARRQQFLAQREARQAFAQPSLTGFASTWFDWDVLGQVLASPQRDVIVTRDGALPSTPEPRDAGEARAGLARGEGLVARRAERCAASLCDLARSFELEFGRRAHVQLFVTPQGTRGFRWHYDVEDVVIVQTAGRKSYYLRENTRLDGALLERADFSVLREEVSPIAVCTLCAGDALYLPRGMWHMGKAEEDSFSISVGLEHGLQR